jgi:hypothetical protein
MTTGAVGGLMPVAANAQPGSTTRQLAAFEAAKAASLQRSASNIAVVDSLARVSGGPLRDKDAASATRRVDGRTFALRDGGWVDTRYHAGMQVTTIKPYSKAYFDVVQQIPELKSVFTLGDHLTVVGKAGAIRLNDSGAGELSPSALAALVRAW